jgi:hypothetical protein
VYASTRSGDSGHEDGRTSFVSLRPHLSVLNTDRPFQLASGVLYVRPPQLTEQFAIGGIVFRDQYCLRA